LNIFKGIEQINIPITTHIWAYARWNTATWAEDKLHKELLKLLEKEKPNYPGNLMDTLIGKTAIENGITLISNDKALQQSVKKLGGMSLCLIEFLDKYKICPKY
jgi:predicted nucleic acid-binding protein